MNSLMLQTLCRFISPFLLVLSVFLLLRGHNEPGGGFAGGLVAAATLALIMFAFDEQAMLSALRVNPRSLAGFGLLVAITSALPAVFQGNSIMQGAWFYLPTPLGTAHLGTPLAFDLGVYLVVVGVTVSFMEDMHR